ncbi:MAG: VOC family protein [Burkholderiaceae bacterium]
MTVSIDNALASLAVRDIRAAASWYEKLLGRAGTSPMQEVTEWSFPRGGGLQVYENPQRAGQGSCTLAISDVDAMVTRLASMGVDTSERTSSERVRTVMVTDPDGNHLAFAQAIDRSLAR